MLKRGLTILAVVATAFPALAQDTLRDWDFRQNTRDRVTLASAELDNGLSLAVRCVDGSLEALMLGLPEPTAGQETRPLEIAFGADQLQPQTWNVGIDRSIAVSELPAPFARKLREGGRLQVRVPRAAAGGRNLRYDLTLPASSTAIDRVLSSCRRPLVDPRDAELAALPELGLPIGVRWARAPRAEFPTGTHYARGFAVVSCMTTNSGVLRDCVIESEHPGQAGFGRAALRAAERARTRQDKPEGVFQPVKVVFRSQFFIPGYERSQPTAPERARGR
jgi:TonB family protein